MALPKQTITILDPGLGLVEPAPNAPLYSGVSSAGTVDFLYSFSSPNDVRSTLGFGDLTENVAKALQERGGPVMAIRKAGSVAAANSAVTQTGGGPAVTIAGTATMRTKARIEIMGGGALGVGTFRFSLDHHAPTEINPTWSATRTIPGGGTYLIPNTGITATFPAGTYVVGDTYDFTTEPARMNASDLADVNTVLVAFPTIKIPQWFVTDRYATGSEGFTIAAALAGHLTGLATSHRYGMGALDVGSVDTAANVLAAAASFSDKRVSTWYGDEFTLSVLPFEGYSVAQRPCVHSASARIARELISTDMARFASGSLGGVRKIAFDGFSNETLDNAGVSTLRTWPGNPGFYIANGRIKAPSGSDFRYVQYRRIMDRACTAVYEAMLPFIAEGFRTIAGGVINPLDAADVMTAGQNALNVTLLQESNARGTPGHVSSALFNVDMLNNLASSGQLKTRIALQPLGYAREIVQEIGFAIAA
jgi:hypothetical protein